MLYFNYDQAALSTLLSVCPSVRPSVCMSLCYTFSTMFLSLYHHEIFRRYHQWQKWCPCKRSRTEVKGQGHRGQNPIELFPDRNSSLNLYITMKWCTKLDVAWERCPIIFQCHLSNFKVTLLRKTFNFDPNWPFPDCDSSCNSLMAMKRCTKLKAT